MARKSIRSEENRKARKSSLTSRASQRIAIEPQPIPHLSLTLTPQAPIHHQQSMSLTWSGAATSPRRLLVCSIGNPGPYTHTLHSAGHTLLSALRTHLSYPPFHPSREHSKRQVSRDKALISRGEDALLWQSPTSMNLSGPAVAAAWHTFVKESDNTRALRLVVLHDELELELGKIKVRKPGAGLKGHNGLRSIAGVGGKVGGDEGWWRIGIGIGRPVSRDSEAVSDFVLRKMTAGEEERIKGAVGLVVEELLRLRDD